MQKEIIQVGPFPNLTIESLYKKTESFIAAGISKSKPWEISKESLRRTLNYLVEYLHVPFYLLCVGTDGVPTHFYKVVPTTTAPVFLTAFKNSVAPKKPFRVMQCILKTLSPQSDKRFSDEYFELLSRLNGLPPGVFVLNLSDTVLVPRNNDFPFPIPGTSLSENYRNRYFLPILSSSGSINHNDVTIPTYDDLALDWSMTPSTLTVDSWLKKQGKALFRGSPTGCGRKEDTNVRMRVAGWTQRDRTFAKHIDAGIVLPDKPAGAPVITESLRVDPVHGLGTVNEQGLLTVGFMNSEEQNKYRFRLHIDGNVLAYRLTASLLSDSLVLRVDSPYRGWLDSVLKPGVHYVLVPNDASLHDTLVERVQYYNAHPEEAVAMVNAAHEALRQAMTDGLDDTFRRIFSETVANIKVKANQRRMSFRKYVNPTECQPRNKSRRKRKMSLSLSNNVNNASNASNVNNASLTDLTNAAVHSNRPVPSSLSSPTGNVNFANTPIVPSTPVRLSQTPVRLSETTMEPVMEPVMEPAAKKKRGPYKKRVKTVESMVESNQPVAELNQPVAESNQPVAELNQPVAELNQPVAESELQEPFLGEPVTEKKRKTATKRSSTQGTRRKTA